MTDQGPSNFAPTIQEMMDLGPAAQIPQPGAAPQQQGIDWAAIQAQEGAQEQDREAQRAAEQARLEELQGEYGIVGTAATKLVQGALDALLAPGALVGAGAESAGELLRNKTLIDFGRDLGEASSGASALQALGGLATAAAEGGYEGAGTADAIGQVLKEQEEARPLLSTISKMAGLAAAAVGTGLGAAAHSGRAATVVANALEGASGGAQVAYENSAPLRDVLTSAAVGGVLGGGIAGAGELAQAGVKRVPDLAKVFGEKVQDFADSRALKAVIDRDPEAWRTFLKGGRERVSRVAERIRAADVLGKSDEGMLEALVQGARESSDSLTKVAKHLDDSGIVPEVSSLRARLDKQLEDLRSTGSGTLGNISKSIEREVKPFFKKLEIEVPREAPLPAARPIAETEQEVARLASSDAAQLAEVQKFITSERAIASRLEREGAESLLKSGIPAERIAAAEQATKATNAFLERAAKDGLGYRGQVFSADPPVVFRGAKLSVDSVGDFSPGAVVENPSIWSTSTNSDAALSFARKKLSAAEVPVLFQIEGRSAIPINQIDGVNTFEELLIPTGRKYAVVSADVGADGVRRVALREVDSAAPMATSYRNPSFTELRELKSAIGAAKLAHSRSQSIASDEMRRLYGNVAESLNEAADKAGPGVARLWKESNEAATDFISLRDALENQIARKAKNRFISPSDYGTSVAAGLATAIMSGNPLVGGLAALGTAIGHKAIREGGSAIMSNLANRFARMSTHVSLAKAGGAEAQEVLQAIAKTKAFVSETAERAGANPTLRTGAESAAKQVAAEQLAKKAGPFDPASWASKPLNPLQKVLYRSQILDAVSTDLSRAATEVAQMHPAIPDVLDLRRLSKLTRDADGPEAIGSLQRLTAESAGASPATPTGDAGGVVLRRLGMALDRTDPAQSIAKAHEAAAWFRQAQASAPDELSQQYALRTEQAIRAELSQPHWGQAGTEYAKMAAPPHAVLTDAADPAKVREFLRAGAHLGATARAAMSQLADAFTAAAKLTGTRTPGLAKPTRALEQLFDAAEAALTLDGKPIASIFEAAKGVGVHSGAAQTINETTLAEHVESGLGKIEPLLHGNAPRIAASAATEVASREQYDKRMKVLTRTVAQPDALTRHDMYAGIATQVGGALAQLLQDMPKPSPSIHGKVFETLSQDDLRLANAMWEATTEPLSVLSDLADGTLDPDKAAYAWKQYPALQKATQAGVIDVLMGLPDEKRSELPDTIVTQLDTALGFNGALQDANEPSFAQRMSALYMPAPAKGQPNGMLDTPAAEPTFVERLSGQQ